MARNRKPSRRRGFNLRRVRIASAVTVGALAAGDVVSGTIIASATDPVRIMSVNYVYAISDIGAGVDDGQEFGLAHSDYTDTEIEECLEAAASFDLGNKVAQEQANRLVRSIGIMTGSPGNDFGMSFNDGKPMKTKLNWLISSGDNLRLWVRNGSANVYTTGARLIVQGDTWVKDSV